MKKVLAVDIDGTVFRWHLVFLYLKELAKDYPLVGQALEMAAPELEAHRARKGPFEAYVARVAQLFWDERRFVGISVDHSLRAAKAVAERNRDRVYIFTRELIAAANSLDDWTTVAISGSPQEVVEAFGTLLGIEICLGTIHPVDEGGFFRDGTIIERVTRKGPTLLEVAAAHGFDLGRSAGVGDTLNDASMLRAVGFPICFNPSQELAEIAKGEKMPVAVERKDQLYVLPEGDPGLYPEAATLESILPPDLARALRSRLPPRMLFYR